MEKKNVVDKGCKSTKSEVLAGGDQHSLEIKRHYFLTIESQKQHFNARTIEPSHKRPLTAIERLQRFQRVRDKNQRGQEARQQQLGEQAAMALEIEPALADVQNGDRERVQEEENDEKVLSINHKIGKLNGVESAVNGHENGHSEVLKLHITDSPRDKRSKERSAKSTPTKTKKKNAKLADSNTATDDDKSENSSSIFSKDTEDDVSIVAVTDDYDASAEFVDISLALTPEPDDDDDDEEIDVEDLGGQDEKEQEKKEEEKPPTVQETNILSSLRDRIRFSLSPKKRETRSEQIETPVVMEFKPYYKGVSGRRPLHSPTSSCAVEVSRRVFRQTDSIEDDACLKRKADQDSYSFQAKKSRKESSTGGWSFYPLKWFTSPKSVQSAAECSVAAAPAAKSPPPRKLHDEIEEEGEEVEEEMVVEEAATAVEKQVVVEEEETVNTADEKIPVEECADKQQPEKIVADDMTKIESTQEESVASSKSGKTWSCSVM